VEIKLDKKGVYIRREMGTESIIFHYSFAINDQKVFYTQK